MTPAEREAFVSRPMTAVLSTIGKGGRIHAVPVWYLWRDGTFLVGTDRGSQKHLNAERTGRATLSIVEGFKYVTAEGPVTTGPMTLEDRLALHTHYRGAEAAAKSTADGHHERMVMLLLRPERWLG